MYIFDIDGTIANAEHRVHHLKGPKKNWEEFLSLAHKDKPIQDTIDMMNHLHDDYIICLITGRSEETRRSTEDWLVRHGCYCDHLWMRPKGDMREDAIVKKEIYEQNAKSFYKCRGVFEDRDRVVKMWRDLGLICYQVCEGDY